MHNNGSVFIRKLDTSSGDDDAASIFSTGNDSTTDLGIFDKTTAPVASTSQIPDLNNSEAFPSVQSRAN